MTPILLLVAAGLVALNGFFVGAEFAVLAARRARLEQLPSRSRRARSALRAIEQLPLMISGCQFGITMAFQVWSWLEAVVTWLKHEYVWDAAGIIPPCWPQHRHLVQKVAVLAPLQPAVVHRTHEDTTSEPL